MRDLIQKAARAICKSDGLRPCSTVCSTCKDLARAAIPIVLDEAVKAACRKADNSPEPQDDFEKGFLLGQREAAAAIRAMKEDAK